jgi:beta-glucosidase
LAATWNKDLLHEVGQHLADEARARSAEMLLAPTVCMHRHPLGGRNFESFSEDPLLTGKLAAQYIRGLQEKGVAATIKRKFSKTYAMLEAWLTRIRLRRQRTGNAPLDD